MTSPIPPAAPTRFDLMLVLIGLSLLTGGLVGVLSAVPVYLASGASSLAASAVVYEGTVRNPPTE
ncbi:hypothetical protein ACFO0N_06540 [Halobium salinum]|uniref:Uncharacterized protein n=1 Tax=Halobium salinum TaxID=1364940 RepID=A0ABD5P9M2_9EURY|nr:hypothetical protein [Halobium salinum]